VLKMDDEPLFFRGTQGPRENGGIDKR